MTYRPVPENKGNTIVFRRVRKFDWPQAGDEHGNGVRYVPTADIETWRAALAEEFATKEKGDGDATSDKSGA